MVQQISPFAIARLPRIVFGAGSIATLPGEIRAVGSRALVVTGARSFAATPSWQALARALGEQGVAFQHVTVEGEPSPDLVDDAVAAYGRSDIDVVVGIGGGSALDAAKAIAGMLRQSHSVVEHLEGLGVERPYTGPAVPFIAVPTTAGTGSEATKNAVLSRRGPGGFKKSFRDEALVARVAIVDPELLAGCPAAIIAANGMDAFTQLLESFVSIKANPLTDALAWSGMSAFCDGFFAATTVPKPLPGAAAWPTPRCCRASAWRRPGSARSTGSPRRSAPSFPSPTGSAAEPWWRRQRRSTSRRCRRATRPPWRWTSMHGWAGCFPAIRTPRRRSGWRR